MLTQYNNMFISLCPSVPLSVCPPGLGSEYINKKMDRIKNNNYYLSSKEINAIVEESELTGKSQKSNREMVAFRQAIFEKYFKTLSFNIPAVWEDFLLDLINIGIKSKLAEEGGGNC